MIWLLLRSHVFRFTVCTQSPVGTVRQKCMYSMCRVLRCVTVDADKHTDTQRLPSSATDTYVWPACGHKAVFAEALV